MSASVCESWTAPPKYEVCCTGEHPWGWVPGRMSRGWVSPGEEPLAWTPPCLDHSSVPGPVLGVSFVRVGRNPHWPQGTASSFAVAQTSQSRLPMAPLSHPRQRVSLTRCHSLHPGIRPSFCAPKPSLNPYPLSSPPRALLPFSYRTTSWRGAPWQESGEPTAIELLTVGDSPGAGPSHSLAG